jgi:hypothetical protein
MSATEIEPLDSMVDDDVDYPGTPACNTAWTGWHKDRRGEEVVICKDAAGYLVTQSDGGQEAHGAGFRWRDMKSGYELAGVKAYKSVCGKPCRT